ncbi:MAG: hypothetical protein RL712_970, partial [Bacteroidota bacterium]
MKTFIKGLTFISFIFLLVGCKREPVSWDNRVVAPLFKTKLGLGQIDTKFLGKNPTDSSYTLTYENLVYSYRMANVRAYDT